LQTPIKGRIDVIKEFETHIEVLDFKTGNPSNASKYLKSNLGEPPYGGSYWRQMIFYSILIAATKNAKLPMTKGSFEFIQPEKEGKYKSHVIMPTSEEQVFVSELIKETYTKIMNHEFNKGCGAEDCTWCNFVKNNNIATPLSTNN
jgi:DNA helicase II / ATP-dependent DNA helicase PcrA